MHWRRSSRFSNRDSSVGMLEVGEGSPSEKAEFERSENKDIDGYSGRCSHARRRRSP